MVGNTDINFIDFISQTDCEDASDEGECPATCSFETDLCGWTSDAQNPVPWTLQKASSAPVGAPQADQTMGASGKYVFLLIVVASDCI